MCFSSVIFGTSLTMTIDTKVIIIGAGPAGAGTSIYLSKKGIDHVILDKASFPRDKVCGDACSGKTAFVLRKANPNWTKELFQQKEYNKPTHGILFAAPNGKELDIPFAPSKYEGEIAPGFVAKRLTFDDFLFKKLPSDHAHIFENSSIEEIEHEQNKITVKFKQNGEQHTVTAPVIVGADGDKSIIRKHFINDNISEKAKAVALRAYYKGITGLHPQNHIELHFLPEIQPGYFWIFPLPNGMANVGIGMQSNLIRSKKINLRERMLYAIKNNPNIAPRFKNATLEGKIQGWGLPLGVDQKQVSGDNFILTGDAACLVDPFSGEGIGNALFSGMLAADTIEKGLAEQRFDADFFKKEYHDVLYRRLGDELRIGATLQKLCRFPWLFNMVVNKAEKSPELSKTISCMFTDLDLREQLRKPSFYFKILFNK